MLIWTTCHDSGQSYMLHPSWCLNASQKIQAMCNTDGCIHICALNGLQHCMKVHHVKSNYSLWELVIVDLFDHFTVETTLKAARDQFMTNTK